jgi:hypothetical protein
MRNARVRDAHRARLLAACTRHVRADGVVLVERYRPGWTASAAPGVSRMGAVEVELHDVERRGEVLSAAVTYRVGPRAWTQPFTAVDVDDDRLVAAARGVGLELARCLDEEGTWALLRPAAPPAERLRGSSAGSSPHR